MRRIVVAAALAALGGGAAVTPAEAGAGTGPSDAPSLPLRTVVACLANGATIVVARGQT